MDLELPDLAELDKPADGPTYRQMDLWMDRQKDKPAYRDAWMHLKMSGYSTNTSEATITRIKILGAT